MKALKLFLLVTLVLALFMAVPATAFVPTFTGNVETDFPAVPGVLIIEDPAPEGPDEITANGNTSGWNIEDLRLAYDTASDTMYVGVNSYGIVGDVDGDGNPDSATNPAYTDEPDLCLGESVAVYFDLDMVGSFSNNDSWDVIAGVRAGVCASGFVVAKWDGAFNPPSNFGTPLPAHYINPPAPTLPSPTWPDYEFTILNFSQLVDTLKTIPPGFPDDPQLNEFRVGAYMGSPTDGDIGEDFIYYHQSPSTVVTIETSATAVIEGSTVNLTITEENDSTGLRSQVQGPGDPTAVPQLPAFFPAQVVVKQNGTELPSSPLGTFGTLPDPASDLANPGVLDPGEIWSWTISSLPINVMTTFVAEGEGAGPAGFVHTFEEDLNEQAEVDVMILSTDVGISANPDSVECDETFDLTVTELNEGDVPLTNVEVVVDDGTSDIATLDETTAIESITDDDILEVGETWTWNATTNPGPSNSLNDIGPLTATTTYTATGSAVYNDGVNPPVTVTWPDDEDEQESVPVSWKCWEPDTDIDIKANGSDGLITVCEGEEVTLTICEENTGDVELTDVYVEFSMDGVTVPLIPELDKDNPTLTGDDGDGVLQDDETWCWTVVVTVDTTTTFDAIGHGLDPADNDITPPIYPTEYDEVIVNTELCGGEGCTPGFWKNNARNWGASAWVGFIPSDSFEDIFNVDVTLRGKGKDTYPTPTLLDALNANGGGINALARHAVAALLNTSSPCVNYSYSDVGALIGDIHDAIVAGNAAIQELHSDLAYDNEAGCPISQHQQGTEGCD